MEKPASSILACEICGLPTRNEYGICWPKGPAYKACRSARRAFDVHVRDKRHVRDKQKFTRKHGDWQSWWEKQQGLCYLCEEPLPADRSKMAMDHDHACCPGANSCSKCRRGLVHHGCNHLIGLAGDDPEKLMRITISFGKTHEQTRRRIGASS